MKTLQACSLFAITAVATGASLVVPIDELNLLLEGENGAPCDPPKYPTIHHKECTGGFPATAGWLRKWESEGETAKLLYIQTGSRFVKYHPEGWGVNNIFWKRMAVDMIAPWEAPTVIREQMRTLVQTADVKLMVGNLHLETDRAFHLIPFSTRAAHKTFNDGTTTGFLVLWGDRLYYPTLPPREAAAPIVEYLETRRNASRIVVICAGGPLQWTNAFELASLPVTTVILPPGVSLPNENYVINNTRFVELGSYTYNTLVKIDLDTYNVTRAVLTDPTPAWLRGMEEYTGDMEVMERHRNLSFCENPYIGTFTSTLGSVINTDSQYRNINSLYISRISESQGGNLLCDVMRTSVPADVAILNGGAVRGNISEGAVHRSDLAVLYPFSGYLTTTSVRGMVLWKCLEWGVSHLHSNGSYNPKGAIPGSFLQVSGLRYEFNPLNPPMSRVTRIQINTTSGYRDLQRSEVVRIVTISFVTSGGDGYNASLLKMEPSTLIEHRGKKLSNVLAEYLAAHDPYTPYTDGRITLQTHTSTPLNLTQKHSHECSGEQWYDPIGMDCLSCPAGHIRNTDGPGCVVSPNSESEWLFTVLIVAAVVLVVLVPLVWVMTAKQRKIRLLYDDNKIAEECAQAVAVMDFGYLDYLSELENPNSIQAAFIQIVANLKLYRPYLPDMLFTTSLSVKSRAKVTSIPGMNLSHIDDDENDVTVVFTDIQGSTSAWEKRNDAMRSALRLHNRIIRRNMELHGGYEVKTIGDAFMVAFKSPVNGVKFALDTQVDLYDETWPEDLLDLPQCKKVAGTWNGIRVRIGIYSGPVEIDMNPLTNRGDYLGSTVNKAARIEAGCKGGGVLVSTNVLDKIVKHGMREIGDPVVLPLGHIELKGVAESTEVTMLVPKKLNGRVFDFKLHYLNNGLNGGTKATNPDEESSSSSTSSSKGFQRQFHEAKLVHLEEALHPIDNATVVTIQTGYADLTNNRDPLQLVNDVLSNLISCADRTYGAALAVCGPFVMVGYNILNSTSGASVVGAVRFVSLTEGKKSRHPELFPSELCMGMSTGPVCKGNIGTAGQRFATAIGECVKHSQELPAVAARFGVFAVSCSRMKYCLSAVESYRDLIRPLCQFQGADLRVYQLHESMLYLATKLHCVFPYTPKWPWSTAYTTAFNTSSWGDIAQHIDEDPVLVHVLNVNKDRVSAVL